VEGDGDNGEEVEDGGGNEEGEEGDDDNEEESGGGEESGDEEGSDDVGESGGGEDLHRRFFQCLCQVAFLVFR